MANTLIRVLVAAALTAGTANAATAQVQPLPAVPYYAIRPGTGLSQRADSPAQQQVIQNYRTQLQQAQRDMLLQSPSGLGRDQLDVGRQLNALGPGNAAVMSPFPAAAPAASPSYNLAPFSPGATLSPPFNGAAPR